MKRIVLYLVLLSLVALQVFAVDEVVSVIKDGRNNPMATVTYYHEQGGVGVSVSSFPGLLVKEVGSEDILVYDFDTSSELIMHVKVFEILNPITAGGVRAEIGYTKQFGVDVATLPLVSKLDEKSPLIKKKEIKRKYLISHSTISHAVNLIKDLPKPFQKTVHYPKSAYDQHMQEHEHLYRSMLERLLERRAQFQDFKNRIRNSLGAPYAQREDDVRLQIQAAMDGLDVYGEDIRFVQTSANALLRPTLPSSIDPIEIVAEEKIASAEILVEREAFNKALYADVTAPTFYSDLLQLDIKFNPKDDSDLSALTIYRDAQKQKSKRQKKDQRYYELDFSQNIIEIRQAKKTQFEQIVLDHLSDIATAVNEQNNHLLIESLSFFSKSEDFQKGLAASFANNINPVSFLYPIQAGCESNWCELGAVVGDASSMLLGTLELLGGVGLTIGGSGLAVGSALAASGGAIPALAAASAGALAVIEGLALASHGASVFSNAFGSMYDKITSKFNLRQVFKSKKVMDSAGKLGLKKADDIKQYASKVKNYKGKIPVGDIPYWKGSGPQSGILGINDLSKSNKAIKNYFPKEGGIEYVFDTKTNTFLVGKAKKHSLRHPGLADSIQADHNNVVGGMFSRGKNGEIFLNQHTGHFYKNWTPAIEKQLKEAMKKHGIDFIWK